jgi:hypothetical protein
MAESIGIIRLGTDVQLKIDLAFVQHVGGRDVENGLLTVN